jgi:hypothetical protein
MVAEHKMTTRIKLRRDTSANWTTNNPILAAGEPGLETDTGKVKHGNGATAWSGLDYATGNIKARNEVGYFIAVGPEIPNDNYSQYFESVVADPDGNAYYVGAQNDTYWTHVVKVDPSGDRVWEKEITWADGSEGLAVSAAYNTVTNRLVVLSELDKNVTGSQQGQCFGVIVMNPTTGAIVGNPTIVRDDVTSDSSNNGWMRPIDIVLAANGDPIVGGAKTGNATLFSVTTATGSGVDLLFVDAAQFLNRYPAQYGNWDITGTNISSPLQITGVNYYGNQPATALAHTGTGATFTISSDGAGGYVVDSLVSGGSNYTVGNKIKILGTSLGGATAANDATITVAGASAGAITTATISGTSTGTAQFTATSGISIASGSNATFNAHWRLQGTEIWFPDYPTYFGVWTQQAGGDFVVGDRLSLPAASYGGTTTGTITVVSVDGGGAITDWAFTGTFNTSTIKLATNSSFNFGTTGSWTLQNFESEAFVWTPHWCVTFGNGDSDRVNALARDSQGNIYAGSETYDNSTGGDTRGLLVKLSSTGTLVWNKNFDPVSWNTYDHGYTGVAVDKDDNVIVAQSEQITKVTSTGTVLWQKVISNNLSLDMWNSCVDVDTDGNIYLAAEYDYTGILTGDNFLIVKFDTNGNVLWQREVGTSEHENANWNDGYQILTIQGNKFYLCGSSPMPGNDVGLGISMPTDGTGAREDFYGRYFYRETAWTVSTSTSTVDVMEIGLQSAQVIAATTNTFSVAAITGNGVETRKARTGDINGRIDDIYSLTFEDGTVQKTAYTAGISESPHSPRVYNTNDYTLALGDAGKMIRWIAQNWNSTVEIYVPTNNDVPFPIGTQIHFMKDNGIEAFMFWPVNDSNDITIMPASPESGMEGSVYDTGEGWSVRHPNYNEVPAIATLTKVDTNRWLLSCNSSVHIMDWSW